MTTCIVLVCLAACVALVNSHSTDYKLDPEVVRRYEKNGILPPFQSYHIHVMFIFGNDESINTAMAVRARFVEHFNLSNTANCTGLFHQGRLCMFEVGSEPEVHSPFVSGQWAVFLRTEDFPVCVPWIMQNRGNLDVLVHPNSGMGYNDHFLWPVCLSDSEILQVLTLETRTLVFMASAASVAWDYDQVADWIASLGFDQYKECFRSNMINGRKLIRVDASTLPSMGITDYHHVLTISRKIRELLTLEDPDWSRSISLPDRDAMATFLERKSHTGVQSDALQFEEQNPNPSALTGYVRFIPIKTARN